MSPWRRHRSPDVISADVIDQLSRPKSADLRHAIIHKRHWPTSPCVTKFYRPVCYPSINNPLFTVSNSQLIDGNCEFLIIFTPPRYGCGVWLSTRLSVRVSASISLEPLDRSTRNLVGRSTVVVARSSSGGVALCYVLPVLWTTSRLVVMGRTSCVRRLIVIRSPSVPCATGAESDVYKPCLIGSSFLVLLSRTSYFLQPNICFVSRWRIWGGGHSVMPPRVAYPNFLTKNPRAQCLDVWCEAISCRHINFKTVFQSASEHAIFIQKT